MKARNKLFVISFIFLSIFGCNKGHQRNNEIDKTRVIDKYLYTLDTLQEEISSLREGINYIIDSYNKGNNLMYRDSSFPSRIYFGFYTMSEYGLLYSGTGNNYTDEIVKLLNEIQFGKDFHRKVEIEWAKYNIPYLGNGVYHDGFTSNAVFPTIDGVPLNDFIKSNIQKDTTVIIGSAYFSVTKEGRISVLIDEKTGSYIDTLLVNLINNVEACKPAEINEKKVDYRIWLYYNL